MCRANSCFASLTDPCRSSWMAWCNPVWAFVAPAIAVFSGWFVGSGEVNAAVLEKCDRFTLPFLVMICQWMLPLPWPLCRRILLGDISLLGLISGSWFLLGFISLSRSNLLGLTGTPNKSNISTTGRFAASTSWISPSHFWGMYFVLLCPFSCQWS